MTLSPAAYTLVGLTALVAGLVAVLAFAVLRFAAAARDTRRHLGGAGAETAFLAAALQEAVAKLKAQERANAARADASELLSGQIISNLTAGLLVVGLNGDVRILNPAGRRLLELPEVSGPETYPRSPRQQPLHDIVGECLAQGRVIARRTVVLPEAGAGATHLGVTVSPMLDGDGKPHGAICLFTDLAATRALEEQLRLKESLATVGELTAGIAHEFRNGLATIHGYGKLIDLNALPEAYRPYVEGIRAETEALSQIVTNFLNFARPAQLTLTRVDVRAVCERAAEEVRADARALGGDVDIRGDFGVVDGDEVLLRQAFSNLLRNALEACTGAPEPPRVAIRSDVDHAQRQLRLAVSDNGAGIAPELRERVFQPFFTSKRNGTGLGLALVQKIIVFHNGRITAGESPLGGACMQITLPLAE